MYIKTVREFLDCLRQGPYADGGYPLFFLTSDGETLCPKCAREEVWQIARAVRDKSRDGWRVEGHDANWEDPEMRCAHCNERIESAYAEDQAELLKVLWTRHKDGDTFDGTLKSARQILGRAGYKWAAVKSDVEMLHKDGRLDGWG